MRLLLARPRARCLRRPLARLLAGFVSCNYSGGTVTVGLNETDDAVRIARGGDAINVIATGAFGEGPSILLTAPAGVRPSPTPT